jgi:SNF2 family DNA or RNA helicase
MNFLQALWDPSNSGQLYVWSANQNKTATALADQTPSNYAFSSSKNELVHIFEQLDFEPDSYNSVTLHLPAFFGFQHEEVSSTDTTNSEPMVVGSYEVTCATFDPTSAVSFLTSLPTNLPSGVSLGGSIKFWIECTKLLLELMTQGKFLPGMRKSSDHYESCWQIVLTSETDKSKLLLLAQCMPPACAAFHKHVPNLVDNQQLIEKFILSCGDNLIRLFLKSHPLTPNLSFEKQTPRLLLITEWLHGLTNSNYMLKGSDYELASFEHKISGWSQSLLETKQRHEIKTCLTLLQPQAIENDELLENSWSLEFSLVSLSSPELKLSARDLWQGELGFLAKSDLSQEAIEDSFLCDLGKVAKVFPMIKESLSEAFPYKVELSTSDAYHFLRAATKTIEPLGIAVELPSWWSQTKSQLGLRLKISSGELQSHQPSSLGASHLLNFSWEISLGSTQISLEKLKDIAAKQNSLVLIDGNWVELKQNKIEATIKFLEHQQSKKQLTVFEALQLGLGIQQDPDIYPVTDFLADGWLNKLMDSSGSKIDLLPQPDGFLGELRAYQKEGISWLYFLSLAGLGGCLADDMGLGKTVQFLALLLHEKTNTATNFPNQANHPTLLIVPMSILDNWDRESGKFTPSLSTYVHHGQNRLSGAALIEKASNSDLVITTYSLCFRDEATLANVNWGRIALDEAQNIKNLSAKQTQAVRRISTKQLEDTSRTVICKRIALTGTPLENRLEDLWSIFDFLNPGFLGSLEEFRTRFAIPIERYRNKESSDSLAKVIRPFILRRLKSDSKIIDDLPEKMEMDLITSLTDEQAFLYQQALNELLPQVEDASGIHRKGLVLATITKLKQICDHPVLYLQDQSSLEKRSGKLNRLSELLEVILAENDKVLIFTQFAKMGHLLQSYLTERFNQEVLYLYGSLARGARDKIIKRFSQKDGPNIFVLSLKAGGFGLNLAEANQVIHYDQWWNPAVQEQATDRAYRIGQKRNVQVRTFICKGTLEEKINELQKSKKDLAKSVVGSTKTALTQLSAEELRNILQLTRGVDGDDDD